MITFRIRQGDADDLDGLEPLWHDMVAHHAQVVPSGDTIVRAPADSWPRRRADYTGWLGEGSGFPLIAEADDGSGALGYAFCRVVPGEGTLFRLGETRGELETLVVAVRARGAGVGTALVEAARGALRERGCTRWVVEVAATNPGAIAVYARAGLTPWVTKMLGEL